MATLTAGFTYSDRIRPLLDGRVEVPGYTLDIRCLDAQTLFRQTLQEGTFDVSELSMASHIVTTARGGSDFVGVPAFLSRAFRHGCVYVRSDRGIGAPGDLSGRRVGLVEYQQTAALWMRGILADEYGVAPQSISWVTGGLTRPQLTDRIPITLPADIRVERSPRSLDDLLRAGDIDAVIAPTPPPCVGDPSVPLCRLFDDHREAEIAWHRRTGFFPIMHTVVVRRGLAERDPALPPALFEALAAAKRLAFRDLEAGTPTVMLPWADWQVARTREILGRKYWSYGVPGNEDEIAAMCRYAHADGLSPRPIGIAELFWPGTRSLTDAV